MRIVHLADYAAPYAGGFGPMMAALQRELSARGLTLELVFPLEAAEKPWLQELRDTGATVRLLPRSPRMAVARQLRSTVGTREPTILHGHFAGYDLPAVAAALGRPNVTVVWHIHQRLVTTPAVKVRNTLSFGVLGRRVARVLGVAPDTVPDLIARGVPRDRALFVPNGVDTTRFAPATAEQRAAARRELDLPGDAEVLLHFGWAWQRKGGDVFVDTVQRLRAAGRPVVGLTVGGGKDAEAHATIARAGAADAVRVLAPRDDVRPLHHAADVLLSPSRSEGMPFAVIEGLAAGLPAVASDVTEGHLAIGTDLAGYRLVGLDAAAFAGATSDLLDRAADRAGAENAALREAMVARFDLRPWARGILALYEELGVLPRAASSSS